MLPREPADSCYASGIIKLFAAIMMLKSPHSANAVPLAVLSSVLLTVLLAALVVGSAAAVDLSSLDLRVTDADIQPSVTLKEFDNRTVEEYSVNNNLYMIKITPTGGAPYYLVDEDGSGDMAWNRGQPERSLQVPQWTLMRW